MISLGIVLIILGLVLPAIAPAFAYAQLCLTVGVVLLVIGVVLMVAAQAGHAVGGRRHYY